MKLNFNYKIFIRLISLIFIVCLFIIGFPAIASDTDLENIVNLNNYISYLLDQQLIKQEDVNNITKVVFKSLDSNKTNTVIPDTSLYIDINNDTHTLTFSTPKRSFMLYGEVFENFSNIEEIDFSRANIIFAPESADCFSGCSSLESIDLPTSLLKIGERAFENCTKLITVNLHDGILEIGRGAFSGCVSLPKFTVPSTVSRIRQSTFSGCEKLADFVIPPTVQSFGKHAFLNCESLKEIVIPDGVEELPENVFSGCRGLVKVVLPESVKNIRKNAFSWCESLAKVNIPEAVTVIGAGAFTGCESLSTVNIPENLEVIEYGAFSKCSKLRSLILPNTITSIEENAFNGSNRTLVVRCARENSYVRHYCRMNRVKCKDLEA